MENARAVYKRLVSNLAVDDVLVIAPSLALLARLLRTHEYGQRIFSDKHR